MFLDPFCGSGTSVLEASLHGGFDRAVGMDCNPIGLLIASFKTLEAAPSDLSSADDLMAELLDRATGFQHAEPDLPDFDGRDHWFDPQVGRELAAILGFIQASAIRRFEATWLRCALSSIVTRVSFQDSDTRYVRKEYEVTAGETSSIFVKRAEDMLNALKSRGPLSSEVDLRECNVMDGFPIPDETVNLIVTSPPYANKMDYYLYHKQRMNVLGLNFKNVQRAEIGSRHEYSSQKQTASKWSEDLGFIVKETKRVLRRGAAAIWVIGDSQIAGTRIDLSDETRVLATTHGLEYELLESVPLSQRSRSFNAAFRAEGQLEHTIKLSKP